MEANTCSAVARLLALLTNEAASPRALGVERLDDWDGLLAQAVRHGLCPQLHERLLARAMEWEVPRAALLCSFAALASQRGVVERTGHELARVLRALRTAGLRPVLLKGAHLAYAVYDDPVERTMSDFDLLLREDELDRAERCLAREGYRAGAGGDHGEAHQHHHRLPLLRDGCHPVELHWTLAPPDRGAAIDLDGLFARARPLRAAGEPADGLAPEDLLLHLALHGVVVHAFDHGLRPLLDVRALLGRPDLALDWETLWQRADRWHIARPVALLLCLARREAGAALPGGVAPRLQVPEDVFVWAREQVFDLPHALGKASLKAVAQASPARAFRAVFPGSGTLPPSARGVPLSLPGRVADLAVRYGGLLWRQLRGDPLVRAEVARARAAVERQVRIDAWLQS